MSFASLRLRANKQQGFRFARRREDAKKGSERDDGDARHCQRATGFQSGPKPGRTKVKRAPTGSVSVMPLLGSAGHSR